MRSIRTHLLASLVLGLLVLFAVAGAGFYHFTRSALVDQFDRNLLGRVHVFANLSEVEGSGVLDLEFASLPLMEYQPGANAEYFQVWTPNGDSLLRSRSLGADDIALARIPTTNPEIQDVQLPDGRPGRAAVLRYSVAAPPRGGQTSPSADLILVLARSRGDLDSSLAWLRHSLLALGVIVTIGSVITVWLGLIRGLKPLVDIAAKAASIDPDRMSEHFSLDGIPRELTPICSQLNLMLSRLESAFERERRITASLAHELRTPIAELRTMSEVSLLSDDGESKGEAREFFRDTLLVAEQMERLVNTLLALYRCQTGQIPLERQRIDVGQLIREAWETCRLTARAKSIHAEFHLPDNLCTVSDRTLLSAMFHSLLSNAAEYTPSGGDLRCDVVESDGGLQTIRLTNTADQLESSDVSQIFEPLWRKDAARSDDGHLGLGLTLVAAYGRLLGLAVAADMPRQGVFQVSVALPPSPGAPTRSTSRREGPDSEHRGPRPSTSTQPVDAVLVKGKS